MPSGVVWGTSNCISSVGGGNEGRPARLVPGLARPHVPARHHGLPSQLAGQPNFPTVSLFLVSLLLEVLNYMCLIDHHISQLPILHFVSDTLRIFPMGGPKTKLRNMGPVTFFYRFEIVPLSDMETNCF